MLVFVVVFAFYFQVLMWLAYSLMGALPLGFALLQLFWVYPGICTFCCCFMSHVAVYRVAVPYTAMSVERLTSQQVPLPSLHVGEGYSSCFVPSDTQSTPNLVCINPRESTVVIRYQVDEFTHTWLTENFFA